MFPSHLDYLKSIDFWFNPCWGYFGFWKRLSEFRKEKNLDFQSAWSHRGMKRNKEVYVSALTALSWQYDNPKEIWWFAKPSQDPPDGVIGTLVKNQAGHNIFSVRELEIVEYLGGASIYEMIKRKMDNKAYEPNTFIICFLSPSHSTEIIDLAKLSADLVKIKSQISHIFIVFHGLELKSLMNNQKLEEMAKISFVQVVPKYASISFSPNVYCKDWHNKGAWIKLKRGLQADTEPMSIGSAPKLFD